MDGAGVDLLALVQFRQQAALFQHLGADGGDVHKGLGPLGGLFRAVDLHAGGQIAVIGLLHGGIVDLYIVNVGGKGGVAAMIGPVGVHDADLGDGGVPLFLVPEVILQKLQVVDVHGQAQLLQQRPQAGLVQGGEARHRFHGLGPGIFHGQGLGFVQRRLPGLHGVDDILLDGGDVLRGQVAVQGIDLGGADNRALALALELDALGGGVGPLVKLAGQGLHGKDRPGAGQVGPVADVVQLGLGKHSGPGSVEQGFLDALHIIAVQDAHLFQGGQTQKGAAVRQQAGGFGGQAGLFLDKNTVNHAYCSSLAASARWPMSRR